MKTIMILIFILAILGLFFFAFLEKKDKGENANSNTAISILDTENGYAMQSDSKASVTVDVAPSELGINKLQNIFDISFNTHSVEMDYDFSKVIVLKDNMGNTYEALEWTGGQGGHHVSGDIIFSAIDVQASSIEIDVLGVGGVDRKFRWHLL